jgi:hypothetical protein
MNIKSFYLAQLHNGEHAAFHGETFEQLLRADPVQLGVAEQAETYRNAIAEQKLTMDVFAASELSPESVRRDQRRDRAYSSFKAWLKVYAGDADSSLSEAAERLLFVVRESAKDVGDPTHLGMTKETTAINSLLRNLEPLRADVERIGAAGRLDELTAANRAFEELQIERNVEKAGKHSGNVKAARAATDAAYAAITERIRAQALLKGDSVFEAFISEQNAVIDKYSRMVAQRKGVAKKGGTNEVNP